ncbi:MAG: JAB domain-containing protein [Luteolibacter sp.]|uniref:JAB domain-containing protein n=1 Tax=Luteolibacter sp. TaxID=1962973 RepID=UPI0032645574
MKFVVRDFRPQLADPKPSLAFQDGTDPKCIFEYYQQAIASEPDYEPEKEHLVIICVTARMRICGWNMVSVGTLTEALVHPREVFRPVIVRGAYGFVVCHNHPTGDPSPSQADMKQTRRLSEGAEILRLKLIDHVIIGTRAPGREPYYSFREGGLI